MALKNNSPIELVTAADRETFDDAVTSLQVRVWFSAIKKKSGLSTNEIARRFPSTPRQPSSQIPPKSGYLPSQSGYWDRLRRGQHLPLRRAHGRALVDLIEEAFPGTKRWIVWPLWNLLRTQSMELREIHAVVRELHLSIRAAVLINPETGSVFARVPISPKHLFKKLDIAARPYFPNDENDVFGRLSGGVVATLGLIREAELIHEQPLHVLGRKAWLKMTEKLQYFVELEGLLPELQELGRLRFSSITYSPDGNSAFRLNF